MNPLRCLAGLACTLVLLAGCGGSRTVESKGTIMWEDGTPIPGANIRCVPKDSSLPEATGFSDKDGKFALQTNKGPGVPIGTYTVAVTKTAGPTGIPEGIEGGQPPSPEQMAKMMKGIKGGSKNELPVMYADPAQSPLELKVTGANDKIELKLKKS